MKVTDKAIPPSAHNSIVAARLIESARRTASEKIRAEGLAKELKKLSPGAERKAFFRRCWPSLKWKILKHLAREVGTERWKTFMRQLKNCDTAKDRLA